MEMRAFFDKDTEENVLISAVKVEPDLTSPDIVFGFVQLGEVYYFGELVEGKAVWLKH